MITASTVRCNNSRPDPASLAAPQHYYFKLGVTIDACNVRRWWPAGVGESTNPSCTPVPFAACIFCGTARQRWSPHRLHGTCSVEPASAYRPFNASSPVKRCHLQMCGIWSPPTNAVVALCCQINQIDMQADKQTIRKNTHTKTQWRQEYRTAKRSWSVSCSTLVWSTRRIIIVNNRLRPSHSVYNSGEHLRCDDARARLTTAVIWLM